MNNDKGDTNTHTDNNNYCMHEYIMYCENKCECKTAKWLYTFFVLQKIPKIAFCGSFPEKPLNS